MKIYQSGLFERKVKKFNKNEKSSLDNEIKQTCLPQPWRRQVIQDPSVGIEKKGDLKGVFIHKFKIKTVLYLLSYRLIPDGIELVTIGSHENYYRNLKSYLKKR